MADKKISQLPVATTPLAGTEVLPIVQAGVTDQVSVANLTAGRVPAMNNAAMGYTAVTSAAGTTTLTATSNHIQRLTGSAAQTYKLPDATTMTAGTAFLFDNDSTGLLTVVDNASGAVTTVPSNSIQYVYLMTNATAAGTWGKYSWTYGGGALSITAAKSASITNSLTLSGTDTTTMTFPSTSATVARTDAAQTFTGTQTFGDIVSNNTIRVNYPSNATWYTLIDCRDASAYMGSAGPGADTNFLAGGSVKATLSNAGNLSIANGNLVIGTSGKGIDFSATPDATATSELLADYEEGTWTPEQDVGLIVVGTFSSSGTYTKVGRIVYLTGVISATTSVAFNAGQRIIKTLPYAPATGGSNNGVGFNDASNASAVIYAANPTYIYTAGALAATPSFSFSLTYRV